MWQKCFYLTASHCKVDCVWCVLPAVCRLSEFSNSPLCWSLLLPCEKKQNKNNNNNKKTFKLPTFTLHLNYISITTKFNLDTGGKYVSSANKFCLVNIWTFISCSVIIILSGSMLCIYKCLWSLGFLPTLCGWYDVAWNRDTETSKCMFMIPLYKLSQRRVLLLFLTALWALLQFSM